MAKTLFIVTASVGMMVWADSEDEARNIAENHIEEEVGNVPPLADDFIVSPAATSRKRAYADGWGNDDNPYGQDSGAEKTVGELFDQLGVS